MNQTFTVFWLPLCKAKLLNQHRSPRGESLKENDAFFPSLFKFAKLCLVCQGAGGSPPSASLWGEWLIQQGKPALRVRGMLASMAAVLPPSTFTRCEMWAPNCEQQTLPACFSGFAVSWYFIIAFVTQKVSVHLNKKPFKILHRTFYGMYMVIPVFESSFL